MPDLYSLLDSAGTMLTNFNFMLRVNGIDDVPLKSVRAFTRENEYDYIQEGGLNDYVHMRRKPVSKPFTLVCERYIPTQFNDPLSNGSEMLLPLMLFIGRNVGRKFNVVAALRCYVFTGAVVMSKEYGQLDAEHAGLLTETVTIGYNRMFCVTNPTDDFDEYAAWKMNETLEETTEGNTKQLYSKNPKTPMQNGMSKKGFTQLAKKFKFADGEVLGNGELSAAPNPNEELSKGDMVDRRRSYIFAAENNENYQGDAKSVRSAQNAQYSDKTLGENRGIKELTKKEMANLARKFELTDAKSFTGNNQLSSKRNDPNKELHLEDMMGNASKWEFDGPKKEGAGAQHGQNAMSRNTENSGGDNVAGVGAKELSKDEMAQRATRREFGSISTEPVKSEFTEASSKWEFEGTSKDGNGKRSRQNAKPAGTDVAGIGAKEASKDKMAKASHKWAFTDKYSKEGNNVRSGKKPADVGIKEANIEDMQGKSARWEFDGTSKDGKGKSSRQNAKADGGDDVSGMGVTELSRQDFEEAAAKWEFTDQFTKEGGGVPSRNRDTVQEATKKEFEANANRTQQFTKPASTQPKAKLWRFSESGGKDKAGAGDASRMPAKPRELTKAQMAAKASHHVKQSIEDFLMK